MTLLDIAIADIATGQVKSFAGCSLKEYEALELCRQCNDNLHYFLIARTVESNSCSSGDFLPVDEGNLLAQLEAIRHVHKRDLGPAMRRYWDRKANCVCVVCESPQLETECFCANCAQTNRERSAKSYAESR